MEQIKNHAQYLHHSLLASTNERGINLQSHEVEEKYSEQVNEAISQLEKRKESGKEKAYSIVTGEEVEIDSAIKLLKDVLAAFPGKKSEKKPKVEKQSEDTGENLDKKVINPNKKGK